MRFFLGCFFLLALATGQPGVVCAQSLDAITLALPNQDEAVAAYADGGHIFVAAAKLASAMGGSYAVSASADRITISLGASEITVRPGNPFISAGAATFTCLPEPRIARGDLFVPLEPWIAILNRILPTYLAWDSFTARLSTGVVGAQVTAIQCTPRKAQTMVEIRLDSAVRFSTARNGKTLLVSIPDGIVASSRLNQEKRIGHVRAISVEQRNKEALVSILMSDSAQPGETVLAEDPWRIRIVLNHSVPQPVGKLPAASADSGYRKSTSAGMRKVVIDPGHGGKDPGATGPNGIQEKDIVLSIALILAQYLRDSTDLNVILTRSTDEFIPLAGRTQMANDSGADLFLSLHCNSIGGGKQRVTSGFKAYINRSAISDEDKLVAMKENAAIEFETETRGKYKSVTEGILLDLMSNEFLRESEDWAGMIVESMEGAGEVVRQHTGLGQAGFFVLNGAYMPSVLFEIAYISHPKESKLLQNKTSQRNIALALLASIRNFIEKYGSSP